MMRLLFLLLIISYFSVQTSNAYAQEYKLPNIQNLSKAYWALEALDINNDQHIDNFLLINECEIFTDFISDDFEWREIRAAARAVLENEKESFPRKFRFLKEIRLDNYDFQKSEFPLYEDDVIRSTRRFLFQALQPQDEVCKQDFDNVKHYPSKLLIETGIPISFRAVPADQETAQEYIAYADEELRKRYGYETKLLELQNFRRAYLVFEVSFEAYKSLINSQKRGDVANILARLEKYAVYGQRNGGMLLYEQTIDQMIRVKTSLEEQYKALRDEI